MSSLSSSSSSSGGIRCVENGGRELHVLAVDDSSVDRKLIEKLLKGSSSRVTTVDSGKRALELLEVGMNGKSTSKEPKVNMIITDYCMPEMTGYDLLKRVKESSVLKEIPVVVVSSENVPNRINRCLEEGAEEFLLKPLRQSDVSRLCSRMVQKADRDRVNLTGEDKAKQQKMGRKKRERDIIAFNFSCS